MEELPNDALTATLSGDIEAVRRALDRGVHPDAREPASGRTMLHFAIAWHHQKIVDLLLFHRASPDIADKQSWTPLHFAAEHHDLDAAKVLLKHGADVNPVDSHGNTPLSKAAYAGRREPEMVRLLLRAGADVHRRNNYGVSPLSMVLSFDNRGAREAFRGFVDDAILDG